MTGSSRKTALTQNEIQEASYGKVHQHSHSPSLGRGSRSGRAPFQKERQARKTALRGRADPLHRAACRVLFPREGVDSRRCGGILYRDVLPAPNVPAECDAAAVCAVLNDFPAVRSAFATLFRGQGGTFQGPAHNFLIAADGRIYNTLSLAGGTATLRRGEADAPQVYYFLNGRALYARLGKLLFGAAWPVDA